MDMISPRRSVVLVTGARAPAALHAARLFHSAGIKVIAADCISQPLTRADRSIYDTVIHPAPGCSPHAFRSWLIEICEEERVDMIFPTCEEVFHVASALDGHILATSVFAPYPELLLSAHSKIEFAHMLGMIDLEAPWTERLRSREEMVKLGDLNEIVLKPEFSRFATKTFVRPTPEEVAGITPSDETPWAVQEALSGPEVCTYCTAVAGDVTAFAAYHPRHRAGRGAGTYFEPVKDSALENYVSLFASRTAWTGQFGLDVIMTKDRGPVAIECNPRATSGIHFFTQGVRFVEAVTNRGSAMPDREPKMIKPVLWTDGLFRAILRSDLSGWRRDVARASDALAFENYETPVWQMLRTTAMFAARSIRSRTSLLDATTSDIAWNGRDRAL
jgi:hypothetical protein